MKCPMRQALTGSRALLVTTYLHTQPVKPLASSGKAQARQVTICMDAWSRSPTYPEPCTALRYSTLRPCPIPGVMFDEVHGQIGI
jgi:hypothetical protein